jgi:hypothetical protein
MKKSVMVVLLLLIVLVFIEALSFVFFTSVKDKFSFKNDKVFLLRNDRIEAVKKSFDPTLGWKTIYDTKFGERPREKEYSVDLLSSFGDSFTHCDQVNHDETWQTYLSQQAGANVYNFGNGAYGTDQAYLRFKQDFPKVKTRIVTLGLITENICRIAAVYRAFSWPGTGMPATKPRFEAKGDKLVLIENPVRSVNEISKLQDINYLRSIGRYDYWYNHQAVPELKFPYTRILFNGRFWEEVNLRLHHKTIDEFANRMQVVKLWEGTEYEQLMYRIFDNFVNDAKSYASVPVIMIFPMKEESEKMYQKKKPDDNFERIKSYCRKRGYLVFDGGEALLKHARSIDDIHSFYVGHLSPLGNKVIAEEFHLFLKNNKLLQE